MRKTALLVAALLAACSTAPAAEPAPPVVGGSGYVCRSDALGAFAGREATAEVGSEILRVSGARVLRWVQPGMMVTMEFRADRVTVWIGPGDRIQRVSCG